MRKKYFPYLYFVTIFVLAACSPGISPSEPITTPGINFEDCQLSMPGSSYHMEALCGKLSVYENRSTASGRLIELNIAKIPAVSRNPLPDPIFFIPGGPGEAATQSYLAVSSAFENLHQKRDIILVDQRGTGGSHPLQCKSSDEEETKEDDLQAELSECLAEQDADPRLYTTAIAMDDLDQVRAALGYERINLYGGSYGTRAALAYMRQHPEHVRTVVLDGLAPPNWTLGPSVAKDAQRALDMIFARCAADKACQAAFPDLPQKFQSLVDQLDRGPVEVTLEHPINGEPTTVELTREQFANTIHMMSYTAESVALIPLLIYTAYTEQDFSRIASITLSNAGLLEASISIGMRYSVICAEDTPFYPKQSSEDGYMGNFITRVFSDACAVWPRGEIPADFREPVQSDTPALLISGEEDPVTPPANGELAAQTLTNSLQLTVPGMGHINVYRGCVPRLMTEFINTGSTQGLQPACVEDIQPSPFFINFNGPTP
jgi:pimeloyl-ACP methyl ester carboxylesterase